MQLLNLMSKISQHHGIVKITSLVLACFLVWSIGQSIGIILSDQNVTLANSSSSQIAIEKRADTSYLSQLQAYQLFGSFQVSAPKKTSSEVRALPTTRLKLVLNGVVVANPASHSLALITNGREQNNYAIGEVIEGTRATLLSVLNDRVVIDNQGREETLFIMGESSSKRKSLPRSSKIQTESQNNNPIDLSGIKDKITKDPSALFQYVRLSQVKKDGEVSGYRLTPGKSSALFEELGLERGDIAIRMNGIDLRDPQAMSQVQEMMKSVSEVNLTVERDGQREDIYMQF